MSQQAELPNLSQLVKIAVIARTHSSFNLLNTLIALFTEEEVGEAWLIVGKGDSELVDYLRMYKLRIKGKNLIIPHQYVLVDLEQLPKEERTADYKQAKSAPPLDETVVAALWQLTFQLVEREKLIEATSKHLTQDAQPDIPEQGLVDQASLARILKLL